MARNTFFDAFFRPYSLQGALCIGKKHSIGAEHAVSIITYRAPRLYSRDQFELCRKVVAIGLFESATFDSRHAGSWVVAVFFL